MCDCDHDNVSLGWDTRLQIDSSGWLSDRMNLPGTLWEGIAFHSLKDPQSVGS